MNNNEILDGEIYIDGVPAPDMAEFIDLNDENPNEFELFEPDTEAFDAPKGRPVIFERALFKVKDPLSPPHTKKSCAKWAKPLPGTKICIGWKIQYRWLYKVGRVKVTTLSESEAKRALEECILTGAVAAAIAGYASGGTAAAAEIAIKACLVAKLGDKLIGVSVSFGTTRGGWE